MNGTGAAQADGDDDEDDLVEGWFEQGEMGAIPEAASYEEKRARGSRVGVVIAAISAAALTLVIVFAGHV